MILAVVLLRCSSPEGHAPPTGRSSGPCCLALDPLVRILPARSRRTSSHDTAGGNLDCLEIGPGETAVLADIRGPGMITHIYFTMLNPDPLDFRDAVVRMYWDGGRYPSVEVPFGDLFCVGHARPRRFDSAMMAVTYGRGPGNINCGLNCYFPMPFDSAARIEIVNESDRFFGGGLGRVWYHIDYEVYDVLLPEAVGRFHALWRRESLTVPAQAPRILRGAEPSANRTGAENYVILDAVGHGHVVGLFLQVDNVEGGWYGEGDDMIFIDGDTWPPSIHGTGTEELFGAGALPDREFSGHYTGFLLVENQKGKTFQGKNAMYRWYVRDPVRFTGRIRMTLEHGHANKSANDYTSVVYWYQKNPHAQRPPLPPLLQRRPRLPESFYRAQALGAEVNRRLLPVRKAFFEEGAPMPDWINPLDVKLCEAYESLCSGRHDRAGKIYSNALEIVLGRLGRDETR